MGKKGKKQAQKRHSVEVLRPTKMTNSDESFEQIGTEPKHFASKLFMDLLNKRYSYLFGFIGFAVVGLVFIFWLPFVALILSYKCPTAGNGTLVCNPPLTEAYTAWDAFAVAFASLFAVPTNYTANNVIAVTLVAIEFAVGKLAVAGLTALLVIKVSRVPNNLVLSSRVLVHKPKDDWKLSMRIGVLHSQTISGAHVRLSAVMRKDRRFHTVNLPFDSSKLQTGFIALRQEPMSFSHTINEKSPLYSLDFTNVHSLKKELLYIMITVHGFDDITGRSLGIEKRYNYDRWNLTGGTIFIKERGYMADVVLRLSDSQKKITGASHSLAINWPNFNLIKEASKGKKKRGSGGFVTSKNIFNQVAQMEEGVKSPYIANSGNGGAVSISSNDHIIDEGEEKVQSIQEVDDIWKSKKHTSMKSVLTTSSSDSVEKHSFSSNVPISKEAMELTPRSLTNEIDKLTKKYEMLQNKDNQSIRKTNPSSSDELDSDSKTLIREERKKMQIGKERVSWTAKNLDLARKKYDHLNHKVKEFEKNNNESIIDRLFEGTDEIV
jgi:hypothetical protein